MLTWWQGYIPPQGFGQGEEIIDNSAYQQIGRVHAGNGYKADLHDFKITPQDTALLTVFDPIDCNLSVVGGPSGGAVTDSIFQEIDLRTGLVRREWHSLDHVPLGDSYSSATGSSAQWPFDYFHLNSIDQHADGTTLISARNTWAMYLLNTTSGRSAGELGGRHSSVRLGAGTRTGLPARRDDARQRHDQRVRQRRGAEGPPTVARRSCSSLDREHELGQRASRSTSTARALVRQPGEHPTAGQPGRVRRMGIRAILLGIQRHRPAAVRCAHARLLRVLSRLSLPLDRRAGGRAGDRRRRASSGGRATVYASWNGDTRTASWRMLAGASAQTLAPVATAPRSGFETSRRLPAPAAYVAVQALDASGAVLASSRTIPG